MSRRGTWRTLIAGSEIPIKDALLYCDRNGLDHRDYTFDAWTGRCMVTILCSRIHWKHILGIVEGRV